MFYNGDNSIGVIVLKISCLADFAPLLRILCILLSNGNIGTDQSSNFPWEAGIPTIQREPAG
jgi:hypothetical protein